MGFRLGFGGSCSPCCGGGTPPVSVCGVVGCSLPSELTVSVSLGNVFFNDNVLNSQIAEIRAMLEGAFVAQLSRAPTAGGTANSTLYVASFKSSLSWIGEVNLRFQLTWQCSTSAGPIMNLYLSSTEVTLFLQTMSEYKWPLNWQDYDTSGNTFAPQSVSEYCASPSAVDVSEWHSSLDKTRVFLPAPSVSWLDSSSRLHQVMFESTVRITS